MGVGTYTQSSGKKRLSGVIVQRGTQTGMPTVGMFLFGLPFVAIGVVVALVGLKIIPVNPSSIEAPYFAVVAFGVVFALGGLMLWNMAWRQHQSNCRRTGALGRYTGEPALIDYDWDPHGYRSHCWGAAAKAVAGAGFIALFLSMFNWWAWFANGPWMVKAIVGLFDLILVYVFWLMLMTLSRAVKFGNSRIEFVRFPYRVGESVTVRWLTPGHINRANKGTFTLRCIKEWYETTGSSDDRTRSLVHEEQWSGVWAFEQPEDFPAGKNIDLDFQPPADIPATSLSSPPTAFWEFEVKLDLPGPDFKETYLVPVY